MFGKNLSSPYQANQLLNLRELNLILPVIEFSLTLTGTDQPDFLDGTTGDDVLNGAGGGDYIFGRAGDDELNGGDGSDLISGGQGDDLIRGGTGDDTLDGLIGNDTIYGGDGNDDIGRMSARDGINDGNDLVFGGAGNDTIYDYGGADIIRGGPGDDMIISYRTDIDNDYYIGNAGYDTVVYVGLNYSDVSITQTDSGFLIVEDQDGNRDALHSIDRIQFNDIILDLSEPLPEIQFLGDSGETFAGSARATNVILGGQGDDDIIGGEEYDSLRGGDGNDLIQGLGGSNFLGGGDGNDTIISTGIVDIIDGGEGDDNINITGGAYTIVLDNGGVDEINSSSEFTLLLTFDGDQSDDTYTTTGPGSVSYSGRTVFDFDYSLNESGDLQVIDANGNVDTIKGFETLNFDGHDVAGFGYSLDLSADAPNVSRLTDIENDYLGTQGVDLVLGGSLDDILSGAAGDDLLHGDGGDDTLYGRTGADDLNGGLGNDLLFGGSGDDTLAGGLGDDMVSGASGDDTIYDFGGNDILRGGSGDDTFSVDDDEFGDDFISGGTGVDTLIYSNRNSDSFTFELSNSGRLVVTDVFGSKDTLVSVETIVFRDASLDVQTVIADLSNNGSVSLSSFDDLPVQSESVWANAGNFSQVVDITDCISDFDFSDFVEFDIWL